MPGGKYQKKLHNPTKHICDSKKPTNSYKGGCCLTYQGRMTPLTQNKHVLCSIPNLQTFFLNDYMHLKVKCPRNSKIASNFK